MGIGWARLSSGGGIPDAPSDGNLYGRQDGAWVVIPPGDQDSITFEFSRQGNVTPNAPIGPDSGNNNAPGFVIPVAGTITGWAISFRSDVGALTGGVNMTVIDAAWTASTTVLTAAAAKDPGSNFQRALGATSVAVAQGDLLRITSACSDTVAQITVKIRLLAS